MPDLPPSNVHTGDEGAGEGRILERRKSSRSILDLRAKADLYAEARVPEYWVVNLVDRELVVFRSGLEGVDRHRAAYRERDRVAPRAWEDVVIEVAELFPAGEHP